MTSIQLAWTEDLPSASPAPADLPADWPHRADSEFVDVAGHRWHVQRSGRHIDQPTDQRIDNQSAPRPTMLLVHGTGASTHTWRGLLPLLAAKYDLLAFDLPGHGFTDRGASASMSLPDVAAAVDDLLTSLDFSPDVAVGHSAGAAVLLQMTLAGMIRPRCIVGLNAALLPFGGAARFAFAPLARLFASSDWIGRQIVRRARHAKAVRRVLESTGSKIDDQGVRNYQTLLQRETHVRSVLSMMAEWDLEPLLQALPGLSTRLHLVTADRDYAVRPREAEKLAAALPRITITPMHDCGHLAHEERPGGVADIICAADEAARAEHSRAST